MITWTVGGGLLGGAVRRRAGTSYGGTRIPWTDPAAARAALRDDLDRFAAHADGEPWAIAWAAGAATVAATPQETAPELEILRGFLTDIRESTPSGAGTFFLSSSAGGIYAGSTGAPFSELTAPRPISAYGELKLRQEEAATELLEGVCPVVIGRISNLYGPGQNLAKLQGVISRLALAAVTRQPVNIYVPLSTIRDYIYVDDAADMIMLLVDEAVRLQSAHSPPRIIASGEGTTIAQLVRIAQDITRKRVPIALGGHFSSKSQVLDLRFVPTHVPGGASHRMTSLPVGMKQVFDGILRQLQLQPAATVG